MRSKQMCGRQIMGQKMPGGGYRTKKNYSQKLKFFFTGGKPHQQISDYTTGDTIDSVVLSNARCPSTNSQLLVKSSSVISINYLQIRITRFQKPSVKLHKESLLPKKSGDCIENHHSFNMHLLSTSLVCAYTSRLFCSYSLFGVNICHCCIEES